MKNNTIINSKKKIKKFSINMMIKLKRILNMKKRLRKTQKKVILRKYNKINKIKIQKL